MGKTRTREAKIARWTDRRGNDRRLDRVLESRLTAESPGKSGTPQGGAALSSIPAATAALSLVTTTTITSSSSSSSSSSSKSRSRSIGSSSPFLCPTETNDSSNTGFCTTTSNHRSHNQQRQQHYRGNHQQYREYSHHQEQQEQLPHAIQRDTADINYAQQVLIEVRTNGRGASAQDSNAPPSSATTILHCDFIERKIRGFVNTLADVGGQCSRYETGGAGGGREEEAHGGRLFTPER